MVTTGRLVAQDTLGTKDVSHIQTPVTRIVPPVNVIVSSGSPVRLSTRSCTRRTVVRWSINGASKVRQHGNKGWASRVPGYAVTILWEHVSTAPACLRMAIEPAS